MPMYFILCVSKDRPLKPMEDIGDWRIYYRHRASGCKSVAVNIVLIGKGVPQRTANYALDRLMGSLWRWSYNANKVLQIEDRLC